MNTCRSILAAAAIVALATTAGMAQHGGGKSAPKSGGGANPEGHAPGGAGRTGADRTGGHAHGIDLVRPDDGYASLRRRATRSSLIADGLKKSPAIVPSHNAVVHPPAPLTGAPAEHARNAIGATAPTNTGIGNAGIAHPVSGAALGNIAKTSIGGNVGEVHHAVPHPVPIAVAPSHSTGLSGAAMGRPSTGLATLGGPAHTVSGISGANVRLKH